MGWVSSMGWKRLGKVFFVLVIFLIYGVDLIFYVLYICFLVVGLVWVCFDRGFYLLNDEEFNLLIEEMLKFGFEVLFNFLL